MTKTFRKKNKTSKNKTIKKPKISNDLRLKCKELKDILTEKETYTMMYTNASLKKIKNLNETNQKKHPSIFKNYKKYSQYLQKILMESHVPNKYNIKDNFYTHINYDWLKETGKKLKTNKKYYVQVDDFRVVQEKVYYEVMGYVKQFIKENDHKNSPHFKKATAIKNLYHSLKNTTVSKGQKRCLQIKQDIENRLNTGSMYDLLAKINKDITISFGSPIVWNVQPDEKNVKKYISHLSPPQLGIYDYFIYIDDPKDDLKTKHFKKEFRDKYIQFINDTFKTVLPKDHKEFKGLDVWNVEIELLNAMGCNKVKKDDPDFYNVVSSKDLMDKYNFNWELFSKKLGYKDVPKKVIVSSLNSLKCITELMEKRWNSKEWKTYWLFLHYKQMLRFDNEWRKIYYEFYGKFVKGQQQIFPNEIYPIFGLSFCFNTFLTEEYVKHNHNPIYEDYVRHMGEDLKQIFIKKIKRNKWLMPSTKKNALKKLNKLELIVGKPKTLRYDPLLNYTHDDPWYNIDLLNDWKVDQYIKLEGDTVIDIPVIDWSEFKLVGTQAYIVNAFYRPTSNSIYIPLAYLQKPFIDLGARGIEYNLAYMGYTLGHELSHSLDDMGSKFDENGNMNNWWTDHDRKIFNNKIKDVIKQYEDFAARDGIKFDASIGVGEDLADISGLSLVEEYLLEFQLLHDDIDPIKRLSLEAFYTYSAIQSRQKIFDEALPAQLKINPHPLEKYRCNCPLARLALFRTLYNIKKGDGMYWHNTDTIW